MGNRPNGAASVVGSMVVGDCPWHSPLDNRALGGTPSVAPSLIVVSGYKTGVLIVVLTELGCTYCCVSYQICCIPFAPMLKQSQGKAFSTVK